jgi:hypothetical protein
MPRGQYQVVADDEARTEASTEDLDHPAVDPATLARPDPARIRRGHLG